MDRTVIVAHYDKPLRWVNELKGVDVIVLTSNDGFPYRKVKNRGNDSSHYLSFIIENYDALPEKMVFCHDHERNWTQEHSLPHIINNLNWYVADYFSIGARCNYWTCVPFPEKPYHEAAMRRSWKILEDYLPYPERLTYIAGTQFCVHRNLILKYPIAFYEQCREWVYTTDEAEWFIGRFFEYTWHYIFTGNPIEIDHKYMK